MSVTFASIMLAGALPPVMADGTVAGPTIIEDFTMQPETRWRFFTDQVMGGVSTGGVAFAKEGGTSFARMTGRVSTANRGGFIQMRLDLATPPPEGTTGVRLMVRGNDQRYFVHLRTGGTLLPWQYYQAGFDVTESWSEVRLPLDAFKASGVLLRDVPEATSLTSVAVVAYGSDQYAQIDVREVGFY
ncbi:CIA30 family protein [Cypionkella sp. TWP1-2-1b2]|uniref:CIA30 family protein n=1 Tax=Cypionkella sp. TWP1-2-1b2 TaxID=2804675 RepID=UPI003CE77926